MSELRGLLKKATPGPWARGAWYGRCIKPSHGVNNHTGRNGSDPCKYDYTFEAGTAISSSVENIYIASVDLDGLTEPDAALIVAAVNALPTLLDDLAAAQGEIEALRAAISWLMPPFVDSKTPTEELRARVKVMLDDVARLDARSALTLKSEKAPSSLKGSDVGEVGE